VLVVDDVVTEALYYSGSPAAVTARALCTEAALRAADPSSANDSNTDKTTPVQRLPRMLLATRDAQIRHWPVIGRPIVGA